MAETCSRQLLGANAKSSKRVYKALQMCGYCVIQSHVIHVSLLQLSKVCAAGGTERPFTGVHNKIHRDADGIYRCACCGSPLFTPKEKYDSGTGWPSFDAPVADAIGYRKDLLQLGSTEVHCSQCGAHLGHVFDDGPPSTGLRYCINSVCLWFDESSTAVATTALPFVLNSYLVLLVLIGSCASCCVISKHAAIAGKPVYDKWRERKAATAETAAGSTATSAWPAA